MSDKLRRYTEGVGELPETYLAWQLFGSGFEHLGRDKRPVRLPLRTPRDNEVLLRVDAVGLCYSDVKLIRQGNRHPRIRGRDLDRDPTVPGHECSVAVACVGSQWRDTVRIGDRFIVQADIYVDGVNLAFGYAIPGGLAQYAYVDERVLDGDEGCYLLPVQPTTGYSEAALAEPWACVEMAYNIEDRFCPLDGGRMLIADFTGGEGRGCRAELAGAFAERPETVTVWNLSPGDGLDARAAEVGPAAFDDIVVFGLPADISLDALPPLLDKGGMLALISDDIRQGDLVVDVGRVHYEKIRVVGCHNMDVAAAYRSVARTELEPGGATLLCGAGGPMGQMHVQRAIEMDDSPARIVATEVDPARLSHLRDRFQERAEQQGSALTIVNPLEDPAALGSTSPGDFDDVVVLAPVRAALEDAIRRARTGGVVNVFAGVPIGTNVHVGIDQLLRGVRMIGSSGSRIEDLRKVLDLAEGGRLATDFAVAAVSGMAGTYDGLEAVRDGTLPGKVVVYPFVEDMGLVPLGELHNHAAAAAVRLGPHGEWNRESETVFLEECLP